MSRVRIRYLSAAFREAAGVREEIVEQDGLTLGEAVENLIQRHGEGLRRLFFAKGAAESLQCFTLVDGKSIRDLGLPLADGVAVEILRFSAGG